MLRNITDRFVALVKLLWREVAKFGVVGGIGFFIDTGIFLWLITGPMEDSAVKAKIVATAVATAFSWVANRYWTFRNRRQSNAMRELVLFLVMNGIGAGIQAGFVFIAKYFLGISSAGGMVLFGNVIGLAFATIFRFISYRLWVFTEAVEADPATVHDSEILTGAISSAEVSSDSDTDEEPHEETGT
ncbi:MAG TPA: GtrA family protein [Enteractinococcus helveticum]|uniref:GtrA family protein n=1 Tax=Enteractinococcus helveticum TaxID=1837282 RepID=A0A921FLP8_9MICC|nr:GtrA family protein [Enteractinococcus helveticum]HJF13756.1 GtrA family protein [Enteractinococcus helveticum]